MNKCLVVIMGLFVSVFKDKYNKTLHKVYVWAQDIETQETTQIQIWILWHFYLQQNTSFVKNC